MLIMKSLSRYVPPANVSTEICVPCPHAKDLQTFTQIPAAVPTPSDATAFRGVNARPLKQYHPDPAVCATFGLTRFFESGRSTVPSAFTCAYASADPGAPVSPFAPGSPFGPWAPCGPCGPAGPFAPANPRG